MSLQEYKDEQRALGTDKQNIKDAHKEILKALDWLDRATQSYQAALFIDESEDRLDEWRRVNAARRELISVIKPLEVIGGEGKC